MLGTLFIYIFIGFWLIIEGMFKMIVGPPKIEEKIPHNIVLNIKQALIYIGENNVFKS